MPLHSIIALPLAVLAAALVGATPAQAQGAGVIQEQPSKNATPIEIPGSPKGKNLVKTPPSKSATPIEIPDKK